MSKTTSTVEGHNLVITTTWENLTSDPDVERLYLPGPYSSVTQIKCRNRENGQYFFEPDMMHFFRSRVSDELICGRMFVTSEQNSMGDYPRLYTVRAARDDGTIADVSEFQEFTTIGQAKRFARRLGRMVSSG